MTIGIYLFTNKINGKQYVGQSMNIEHRYSEHKTRPYQKSSSMYNTAFYQAIRKYGFDNFDFTIVDSNKSYTREDLNRLEKYYIKKYDTYSTGYNMSYGGDSVFVPQKISFEDRKKIQDLIENTDMTLAEIGRQFNIDSSLLTQVNQGLIWVIPGKEYPLRKIVNANQNKGGVNPRAKLTDEEVIRMRERFVNETMPAIHKDYPQMSFSEVKKIIYGSQFKHLPVYKKREKKWYLNGTCIDYPRVEE